MCFDWDRGTSSARLLNNVRATPFLCPAPVVTLVRTNKAKAQFQKPVTCQFVVDHGLLLLLCEWPTTAPLFTVEGIRECCPSCLRWTTLLWGVRREQPAEVWLGSISQNLEIAATILQGPTSLW